jgi:hypothetical protein
MLAWGVARVIQVFSQQLSIALNVSFGLIRIPFKLQVTIDSGWTEPNNDSNDRIAKNAIGPAFLGRKSHFPFTGLNPTGFSGCGKFEAGGWPATLESGGRFPQLTGFVACIFGGVVGGFSRYSPSIGSG